MEETSGMNAAETAFFESGGQTDPASVESTSSEKTENSKVSGEENTQKTQNEATQDTKQEAKQETQPKQEKTVPLAALHQARAEIREIKERNAKMEQLFQQLVQDRQQGQQTQQRQPEIPSLDVDPVNHFRARNEMLEGEIRQLKQAIAERGQWEQSFEQRQQQTQQEQQFRAHVGRMESDFAKNTPDYFNATEYLKEQIATDFINRGVDPLDIGNMVAQQLNVLAVQAVQTGVNPAQLAYHMAQVRGFKAPEKEQPQAASKQPANEEKIASINKGQAAAKSLSTTGGKGKPELTLEALAEMDADELEKNWADIAKMMR